MNDQMVTSDQPLARQRVTVMGRRVRPVNDFIEFTRDQIDQSIADRFDLQATKYPSRLAIKTPALSLTYEELNRKANSIARAVLMSRGAQAEPVALLLAKDALLIPAILGVLKTGKFYVPLDPSYPLTRNEHILRDSQAALILTDEMNLPLAETLSGGTVQLLAINRLDLRSTEPVSGPPISPDSIAYVLYTSGSTGIPKGVTQTHRNVLHNVMKSTNGLRISADDRLTLLPSPSVAASVSDIFGALLNGAAVLPFDLAAQGLNKLADWMAEEEVTIYHSVPSVFRNLTSALAADSRFSRLRLIKLGGESVHSKDVELYKKHFSDDCILHVGLGATEINIIRQFFIDKQTEVCGDVVPVGYAVDDTELLLLDGTRQPVGPDSVGEIAIKSRYLTPGYWRQPELSAAAFLDDPRGGDERIYLTGDLGYLLPDGCLVCLGRKDSQVKIRGYRVEAAEVETALIGLKALKEAAVTAQEDQRGEKRLVAYVVFENGSSQKASELRHALHQSLPDFMIPSAFVVLDALPRGPGGKIDRNSLRNLSPAGQLELETFQRPRNSTETKLARIWEQVLGVKGIGIADDFFDLGGDSLAAAHMLAEIEANYGVNIPPSTLLHAPTVEQLAELVVAGENDYSSLVPIKTTGSNPPFFCVHAIGGEVISFRNLAALLGDDQPVYGLRARRQNADSFGVESIAAHYISEIELIDPNGPYYMGGYSFGGTVAFEMARQLVARGKQVSLLALFDTHGPGYPKLLPVGKRLFIHLKNFLRARTAQKIEYLHERIDINLIRLKKSIRKTRYDLSIRTRGKPPERMLDNLEVAHQQATRTYVAEPYAGKLDLFRTAGQKEIWRPDPLLGWGGLAAGGIQVHYIAGEHATLLAEPHVRTLAEKLRECLKPSEKDSPGKRHPKGEP